MHWACLISPARAVFTFITLIQLSIPGKRVTKCPIGQSSLFLLSHPSRTTSITTPPWPLPSGSFLLLLKWKTQVLVSKTFLCQLPQILEPFRAVEVTQVVQIWNTCCLNILSKHCERKQTLGFSERSVRGQEFIIASLLSRIVNNSSYLKDAFFLVCSQQLLQYFNQLFPPGSHRGLNFRWFLRMEVTWFFFEGVQFSIPTVLVPLSLYFLHKLQLLVVTFTSPEKRSFAVSTLCTSVNSVLCFTQRKSSCQGNPLFTVCFIFQEEQQLIKPIVIHEFIMYQHQPALQRFSTILSLYLLGEIKQVGIGRTQWQSITFQNTWLLNSTTVETPNLAIL